MGDLDITRSGVLPWNLVVKVEEEKVIVINSRKSRV
jgi:hypothetical protein